MRRLVIAAIAGAVVADVLVAWWLRRARRRRSILSYYRPSPPTDAEIQRLLHVMRTRPDPADWSDGAEVRPHTELRVRA